MVAKVPAGTVRTSSLGQAPAFDVLRLLLGRPGLEILHVPRPADAQWKCDGSPGGWRDLADSLPIKDLLGEPEVCYAVEDLTGVGRDDVVRLVRQGFYSIQAPDKGPGFRRGFVSVRPLVSNLPHRLGNRSF